MKKFYVSLGLLSCISVGTCAQITKEEYNKLNSTQKSIYDKQSKEIKERRDYEVFKANDREKMGKEMNMDGAKYAGAYHTIKASNDREKAEKKAKEDQERLDKAAREGIKNNEKKQHGK